MPKATNRLRDETGRFYCDWGCIGAGELAGVPGSFVQTDECQNCGKVRVNGWIETKAVNRRYKNREAAQAAGAPFYEGY